MADGSDTTVTLDSPAPGNLVDGLKSFAGDHGGAKAVIEYVGRRGARIVLVGEDGVWSDQFARFKDDVAEDKVLLFEGHVEWRQGSTEPDVIVERVMTPEQARQELTKEMVIRIPYREDEETLGLIDRLRAILPNYRGSCPVWLLIRDGAGRLARMKLAADYWVNPLLIAAAIALSTGQRYSQLMRAYCQSAFDLNGLVRRAVVQRCGQQ